MEGTPESWFCQAVEYNFGEALITILGKVKDPSSFVTKDYNTIMVGHYLFIYLLGNILLLIGQGTCKYAMNALWMI